MCAIGKYKGVAGSASCTICPDNTASVVEGASTIYQCLCAAGYTGNTPFTCTGTYLMFMIRVHD
jgi:hypothetical protein